MLCRYIDSVFVFEGDFTVEADKHEIVDTVIGLWSMVSEHMAKEDQCALKPGTLGEQRLAAHAVSPEPSLEMVRGGQQEGLAEGLTGLIRRRHARRALFVAFSGARQSVTKCSRMINLSHRYTRGVRDPRGREAAARGPSPPLRATLDPHRSAELCGASAGTLAPSAALVFTRVSTRRCVSAHDGE